MRDYHTHLKTITKCQPFLLEGTFQALIDGVASQNSEIFLLPADPTSSSMKFWSGDLAPPQRLRLLHHNPVA